MSKSYFPNGFNTPEPKPVADLPRSCPSCRSSSIVSTARVPDVNSYWRCSACGDVWNPGRRVSQGGSRWPR